MTNGRGWMHQALPFRSCIDDMKKQYDPPLTSEPHSPLYRVDKAIKLAQQRVTDAIDAKRHHTSHSLAHEVVKEAREALRKCEKMRALKISELAASAR